MRSIDEVAAQPADGRQANGRSVYLGALVWLIWLIYMVPVTASLFASHPSPPRLIGSLVGAAVFIAIYAWTAWHNAQKVVGAAPLATGEDSPPALWLPVIAMLALSIALTEVNGVAWGALFIYTCAAAAGRLPTRQALGLLAGVILLSLTYAWRIHLPASIALANLLTIGFAGITTIAMVFAVTTSRHWREEREELARFASVTEERLRIARDLHDLLGRSLSLIALKSDLAQQLIPIAPERASAEVADIERAAREALREVRETVAGYRTPTLAAELHEARTTLAAAGIAYSATCDERAVEELPRRAEAAFSWAVREGVTNVVRHSHARRCDIRLGRLDGEMLLEIDDDGAGGQSPDAVQPPGNGLRGLGERVAAAGGRYDAAPRPDGGFSLRVWMPLTGEHSAAPSNSGGAGDSASARPAGADARVASTGVPAARERGEGA